jgi:flagellar L-ring protein precursor FlgH
MPGTRSVTIACLLLGLSGCDTLDHFQKAPDMSAPGQLHAIPPTEEAIDPLAVASRQRPEISEQTMPGSLWRSGSRSFFRDQRARAVGDLLTVEIEIDHSVSFDNQTQLQRTSTQNLGANSLFGLQGMLGRLVRGATAGSLVDVSGGSTSNGQGQIQRAEKIKLQVAATVIRRLPSGNLEIAGSQEIRVNDELREVQLRGLIRPEDIQYNNQIASDKVAEARIVYGGRGISSDVQRPAWGQQLMQRVLPF